MKLNFKPFLAFVALILFMAVSCKVNSEENILSDNSEQSLVDSQDEEIEEEKLPVIIGNLEIAAEDFQERMDWFQATQACKKMGEGWRLPTIEELQLMYENRDMIGGFELSGHLSRYWSSTRDDINVWTLIYATGKRYSQVLNAVEISFRPVRDKK